MLFSVSSSYEESDTDFKLGKQDFYNESIQHPVGKMTAVLLKLLSYDHLYDRNVYEYLFLFEEQVRVNSERTNFMFARLIADITFLYHIENNGAEIFVTIFRFKNKMRLRNMHGPAYIYTQINLPLFTEMKHLLSMR